MVNGIDVRLFNFQEQTVMKLLEVTSDSNSRQTIILQSPTGSGKTIMLIDYIEEYLNKLNTNVAFIWLCPGKGDLEEQSRKRMMSVAPHRLTQNLFDVLANGFTEESTTFINWELITKKDNTAIREGERKNLYDRIAEAHHNNLEFIIIIDEEHSNNTSKAKDIINHFSAKNIIRVSATANQISSHEFIKIDELDVIDEGLITKAIYVNEGVEDNSQIDNDYDYLLDLADAKRKSIYDRYTKFLPKGRTINPLVLIQFPNGQPETIRSVENKLSSMGYTTDNGLVSVWMSEDKRDLPDNLSDNDAKPVFLLMKQAISTGWDCPRAKILVKLREGMSENFEIQTIGRIRRMPEAKHYDDDILDFCYVYTFDEKYKSGLLDSMKNEAFEIRRLFLKDKCKSFQLVKQYRDRDFNGLGERDVLHRVFTKLSKKYHLGSNKANNKQILASNGYKIEDAILGQALKGLFARTNSMLTANSFINTRIKVDTHKHGLQFLHSTDAIKSSIGMSTNKVRTILERLFRKGKNQKYKILSLNTAEFYAFVINNEHELREEFREITSEMIRFDTSNLFLEPKQEIFKIPEQDFFKYHKPVTELLYSSNSYEDYSSGYNTAFTRSQCERMFEDYCQNRNDIDWVYKNGDSGRKYFSIVYLDALQHQYLFYADYIVMKNDGTVWVIETKGGETKGESRNIDRQIVNKFNAFKAYAQKYHIKWGFVRDIDGKDLYINNSEYSDKISNPNWILLDNVF
ncbi:DEAD/DEAH box helicase [Succinimonas sp.]|uniref:DEAD/DEAH box helicase n=1 Tax=Succinimonas sp. TaxID=1936151 RepID=UPI003866C128